MHFLEYTTHAASSTDSYTKKEGQEESNLPQSFSMRARRALNAAQEEAQRPGQNYIGTEHLLLGLTREETGPAALILENLGAEGANVHVL